MQRLTCACLLALGLSAHFVSTGNAADQPAAVNRPNVIVVITDDQGYGDFSRHGNPVLKTPHLDELAAQSVRLTDFHVTPMCTPSRGQLLTGLDALRNGAMNVSSGRTLLRRGIPTMADLFATAGYQCGQFGKWHLGDNYPYRPQDRGFHEALYYPSSHIGSAADAWNNDYFDDAYWHNGKRKRFEGYTTDVFFRQAMRWMGEKAAAGQPFFCYLATAAAHGPLFVPDRYREPYRGQPRNVASFFGMIANIDENMGRLESFLEEQGIRDNTLVVFLTDNGGTAGVSVCNAGMRGRKVDLYEGGHRVPCFIRWPAGKLRAPADVAELTQVQDLLPTLVDLCGVKLPPDARFDGISLAGLLRGTQGQLEDRKLVIQFSRMNAPRPQHGDACVLWKHWRLVANKELYDVASDPGQQQDVSGRNADVVQELRRHYDAWWRDLGDVNQFSRIVIGADAENPLLLSPCEWGDVFLDQMAQVRRGLRRNGVWRLEVERAGTYEFTLRRWPEDADLAIAGPAPEHHGGDGNYPAGVALPIAKARLKAGDFDQLVEVGANDKAITFSTALPRGAVDLQTWFYDRHGEEICGAYFVYVRRRP